MFSAKGTQLERAVLVVIAVAAVIAMVMAFRFERRVLNQRLLFYQLQSMRKSVDLFKAIEKRNPQSLVELAGSSFSFPGEPQVHRYLESPSVNEKGVFNDPFGNPLNYDPGSGWVKSKTRGYEYW